MNIILTGCDSKTEWQLPWFLSNLRKHNPEIQVVIADFGMSPTMRDTMANESMFDISEGAGWFKKPAAMIKAAQYGEKVVWMDTDCEVRGDVTPIFNMIEPEMLCIAEDRPLNKRQPNFGCWHNTGVVGFMQVPKILSEWNLECQNPKQRGDQEVLHMMFGGNDIKKSQYIKQIPHKYNTLRIDVLDGVASNNPVVMHWTGPVGNDVIRGQINGDPLAQAGLR